MLNYDELEALSCLAREGSFVKAARSLSITQSALSQRIKSLEVKVGMTCIVRSVPVRLTSVGRSLVTHHRKVAELEHDVMGRYMKRASANAPLEISIALNSESLATWFIEAVRPEIEKGDAVIELRIDDQDISDRWLKDGRVMACVTSMERAPHGCTSVKLGEMVYHLVATPEFEKRHFSGGVTAKALLKAPAAIYGEDDRMHEAYLRHHFRGYSKGRPVLHHVPSPEGLIRFAREGWAYALLPEMSIQCDLDSKRLVYLFSDKPFHLKLYWHHQDLQAEAMRLFCRTTTARARKILEGDNPRKSTHKST